LKRILPACLGSKGGEIHIILQVKEKHVFLKRKPPKLEAGVSSTMFPYEI
jgi:hypothetical protein